MLVLKRLDDARRDGDRVYAVMRGIGASSDGKGNAVYAPKAAGQVAGAAQRLPRRRRHARHHRTGRGPRHRHARRRRRRGVGADGGLPRVGPRGDVVRPGLGEVADRPHQGGGGRGRAHQGGAGPAPQGPAADDQGRASRSTRCSRGRRRSTSTRRSGRGCRRRAIRGGPASAPSASAAAISIASSKRRNRTKRRSTGTATCRCWPSAADDPAALDAQLAAWPADLPWDELRVRAAETRRRLDADAACRLVLPVQRGRTDLAKMIAAARGAAEQAARQEILAQPGRRSATAPALGRQAGRAVLRDRARSIPACCAIWPAIPGGACKRWPTRSGLSRQGAAMDRAYAT